MLRRLKLKQIRLNDLRNEEDQEGSKTIEYCEDLTDLHQVMDGCVKRQQDLNDSINEEQSRDTIYRVNMSNIAAASSKPAEMDCDSSR